MPMFQYQFHICNTYPIRLQIIEKHFRGSKRIILQLTMVYAKQFEFEFKPFWTRNNFEITQCTSKIDLAIGFILDG